MLHEALRADVIITSGGTSRGKYDLVHKALAALGIQMRFSTIFVKPGKPTIFGTIGRNLIFGLPGNPSATMLSFEQFIKPALLKMAGHRNVLHFSVGKINAPHLKDAFRVVDSFNEERGGNKEHRRASQVPLGGELHSKGSAVDSKDGHFENGLPLKRRSL
jgi:molybdopterin molybdotransferase